MNYNDIKNKYPFLSEIDCENLYIISKCKISYKEVKGLKRKDLVYYTKNYIKKSKIANKDSSLDFTPFVTPDDIDTLFNYKRHKIDDYELNKILLGLNSVYISNKPNTNSIFKMIKLFKTTNLVTLFSCLIIFLVSLVCFINLTNDGVKTSKISANVVNKTPIKEIVPKEEEVKMVSDDYFKYLNVSMLDVDFEDLKKQNVDTKGWLKVNGTNVNYPFVKAEDNEYYLKHSFDKSVNKKGWVFLDYRNDIDNLSDNTIIYAHGLENNAMFGSLRNTTKEKWYKNEDTHIIKIATEKNTMLFKVFSTYNIEPESFYITDNIKDDNERIEFYNTLKSRSVYDYGVTLNENDKILTLSSCYDNTKRMVVHAKLIAIKQK